MRISHLLVVVALSVSSPGAAQSPEPPAGEAGRFAMTPAEGGFLRLDKQTGAVSFCKVEAGLSVCRASADEKAALETEISRLLRENAELKAKAAGESTARQKGAPGLPSEEELERTLSFTERFMRRMMRVFREEAPGGQAY